FTGLEVADDRLALAERARHTVLPGEANRGAVAQDGGEGQRLGMPPVDGPRVRPLPFRKRLAPPTQEEPLQPRISRKPLRQRTQPPIDLLQLRARYPVG